MSPHLVVALSYHGFGHMGQTAPIIQELKHHVPNLKITLRTSVPKHKLFEKFGKDVSIIHQKMDVGMIQMDALNIDLEQSLQAYREFHRDWESKVTTEASVLSGLKADLVLSNVSYLALAGANKANIPAIGLCSLNWADIFKYFFDGKIGAKNILAQIKNGYNSSKYFLAPKPSMSMPSLHHMLSIGPIAQLGENCRQKILSQANRPNDTDIILISVGGMDLDIPFANWPRFPNTILLVPDTWNASHPDIMSIQQFNLPFIDLVRSSDLLITKPGYGSFVEAACSNTPVLYLERKNWPEIHDLTSWLKKKGKCTLLSYSSFVAGDFHNAIKKLLDEAPFEFNIKPTGINDAVARIRQCLL
ncbi:MAG: hypothetical protein GXP08_06285 [Gammaproteobacteria bacterium]|nr:hypothetical protein [Gammaproteobacteria bacterium]